MSQYYNRSIYTDKLSHNRFCYLFFCVFLLELFLGGSGQEIHITGFLTLRMLNFMVGFVTGLVCMMESRAIPDFVASLLLWFTTLASCSLIVGLLNDASTGYVFEDIKPLSYFYIVIFLYYMIDTTDMVAKTYQLLLFSGKVLVMAYLLYP